MAKLPVHLILYSLYAASTGLIGGIGWTFYTTWKTKEASNAPSFQLAIAKRVDTHLDNGRKAQPERKSWRYDNDVMPWWKQFNSVNLVGKLPPEPTKEPEKAPEPEKKDSGVPLTDIVVLESLLLEVTKATDVELSSHVVVRYKPGVSVTPPVEITGAPAPGQPSWGPGDSTRPAGGPTTSIPMPMGTQAELRQFVHIDDTLWPPHNTLRLARISDDGQTAYFVREDPAKDRSEWKEEPLDKNALDLPPEVMSALREGRGLAAAGTEANGGANSQPPTAPEVSDWRDPPQTQEVQPGNVHVSRRDYDYIRDNSDRVFNDEVAVRSYKSRVGNYEGLLVDRVSPRLQGFGIQPGDVILSVNGEKVKNKPNAYAVGRRQYDAGTRRFLVEILSGRGTGVETRTITVPNK